MVWKLFSGLALASLAGLLVVSMASPSGAKSISAKRQVELSGPFTSFAQYGDRIELQIDSGKLASSGARSVVVSGVGADQQMHEMRKSLGSRQGFVAIEISDELAASQRLTVSIQ